MRLSLLIPTLLLLTATANAGETPWQEVAPGVSLRLISSGQIKASGTTLLGLEIDMPQTTKTYWRVPGDTGLPAEFNFSGSDVTSHQVIWPYPTRDAKDDYLDYAYFGPTVLPIAVSVTPGEPVAELAVVLGVCSDICVPAQAKFTLPLVDHAPDRANGLRIRQAIAMAPMPWTGDADLIGTVSHRPQANAIAVTIGDPSFNIASLIASTATGEPVFGAPQTGATTGEVLIPIRGHESGAALTDQEVQLTFMTDDGAFEVTRPIVAAAAD